MIKNIIKGAIIGIANIIPGVSGGTMAVSMGIYDQLIHCITHLFSELKKNLKFLIPIFLGAGIGLVGLSFVIEYLFDVAPFETNLLFIGLIIGGLPAMWKRVKGNAVKVPHIVAFVMFFALVVGLAAFGNAEGADVVLEPGFSDGIMLFIVGIIAAATMIIPGVSGSMILLLLGYYNPIVSEINNFIRALVAMDFVALWRGVLIFVPFGLGVVAGIFGIAKIIEIVFQKFPLLAYWAIIGLIVSSPFAIMLLSNFGTITVIRVLIGIVALALGTFTAYKLGE
jgi:putative membrane protein